mgnify:CR=1 FL=1
MDKLEPLIDIDAYRQSLEDLVNNDFNKFNEYVQSRRRPWEKGYEKEIKIQDYHDMLSHIFKEFRSIYYLPIFFFFFIKQGIFQ